MNKRYLLIALVGVILSAMLVLSIAGGRRFPLVNKAVVAFFLPIENGVNSLLHGSDELREYWHTLVLLRKENENLKQQNQNLRQEQVSFQIMMAENESLRRLLNYKTVNPAQKLITAKVVVRNLGDLKDTVYVNVGAKDNIDVNMAVLNHDGLVGVIDEVYGNYARVLLITSPTFRIGAKTVRNGNQSSGIIHGVHESDNILIMEHIFREAKIAPDDIVVTNGYSGNHPENIIIGKIRSVRMDEAGLLQIAKVEPAVDPSSVEYVMVVTSFSPKPYFDNKEGRKI